jgi:hypothetical protein
LKVLINPETRAPLVFPILGEKFVGVDREEAEKGEVAEMNEMVVMSRIEATIRERDLKARRAAGAEDDDTVTMVPIDMEDPFRFTEAKDLKRDVRWIAKRLVDVPDGTTVSLVTKGDSYGLDIPEDAKPDRSEGLKVGSHVAIGPNVSPKAMMNARGKVKSIKGNRAVVELDEGDLNRIERSTGKKFRRETSMPLSTLEVVA